MKAFRKVLFFAIVLICLCSFSKEAGSEELALKPYIYQQGFEKDDPTELFYAKGAYTVNFKGLTEERAASGKKSLKIDVTLKGKGDDGKLPERKGKSVSWAWKLPVRVPLDGRFTLTVQMMMGEETSGNGAASVEASLHTEPAVSRSTEGFRGAIVEREKAEWSLIKSDLVKWGKQNAKQVHSRKIWQSTGENFGTYLTEFVIRLVGKEGDRVVVYVDDFKIEGFVPSDGDYQKEIQRRWAPSKQLVEKKIGEWEVSLAGASKQIAETIPATPEVKAKIEEARGILVPLQERVGKIKDKGYIRLDDHSAVEADMASLNFAIENIQAMLQKVGILAGKCYCYETKPTSGVMILPDTFPVPGKLSNTISLTATPGEYEPASFVLRPLSDVRSLELVVSDFKSKKGTIPSSNIDIKIVKCWYQAEGAWFSKDRRGPGKVLIPELLLNDDTLIKVNTEERNNYLKFRFPDGDKSVWIDDPKEGWTPTTERGSNRPRVTLRIEDFPVRDSPMLLPVDIQKETNKQFWVTVKVPNATLPGTYKGRIELSARDGFSGEIGLNIKVLPFKLSEPRTNYDLGEKFTPHIYYDGKLTRDPQSQDVIYFQHKSEAQLRTDLKNIFAHGLQPTVNQPPIVDQEFDAELFGKYLQIWNEAGFKGRPIYFTSQPGFSTGNPTGEAELEALKKQVREVKEFAKAYGVPEIYLYGIDEATGELLKSQRPAWQAVHEAGGKVWVACSAGTFEVMGDLLDIANYAGSTTRPDPKEASKWHSVGHKIWTYAYPQVGPENPELLRRNYGLFLWKANYDGGGPWVWQCSYFGGMWNDFNHPRRSCVMAYPTADGVIDTIAWEGFREGVDDVRYATTLRLEIEKAKKGQDKRKRELALEAERYLDEFDVTGDLDKIRQEIIAGILKLREGDE